MHSSSLSTSLYDYYSLLWWMPQNLINEKSTLVQAVFNSQVDQQKL